MNLQKVASILLSIIILILFPLGLKEYAGNKFYYFLFSLISTFSIFYGFRKKALFFDSFFGLLLWLGFWFKFTAQVTLMNNMFPEGAGTFDFRPNSFDNILTVVSVGLMGFICASFIREKFYYHQNKDIGNFDFINIYLNNRKIILISFLSIIIFFAIINFIYYFFQKGTVPLLLLPFGLNNIFSWLLSFGFATFSSLIIYAELLSNKKFKYNGILIGFLECFISTVSILSRAMIFNGSALLFGYYKNHELLKKKINKKKIIQYFLILIILFFLSLLIVSKIRQHRDFPIGHEVHSYLPTIETKSQAVEEINKVIRDINQILFLIAGRWVGIEGVMCVYSLDNKGFEFIKESLNEKFNYHNSFYENNVKKSFHTFNKDPQIYTVYTPGLFAYLYYSGSKLFLFFGVFFMVLIASFIEFLAYRFSSNNLIFSSILGNIIAYRFAHFGYMPLNSYKILIALLINILVVYLFIKLLKYKKNNDNFRP
ncbi:MAG: hypothetical protein H8E55_10400 [Pelagibacterales bacterium]|nr:hypothetical protein [Pelagibacterales bacterium]